MLKLKALLSNKIKIVSILLVVLLVLQIIVPIIPKSYAESKVSSDGNWEYELTDKHTARLIRYRGYDMVQEIPRYISAGVYELEVTEIGNYTGIVMDDSNIGGNLTIPDSIERIGDYAFYKCSRLRSVEIPSSVKEIGNYAFYYCINLTEINIPSSVNSIEGRAFQGCTNLESVTIGEGVAIIGEEAFQDCGIKVINIPSSVNSIGDRAFEYCTNLQTVNISGNPEIGGLAFAYCTNLQSIPLSTYPSGLSIFYGCNELQIICKSLDSLRYVKDNNIPYILDIGELTITNIMCSTASGTSIGINNVNNQYVIQQYTNENIVVKIQSANMSIKANGWASSIDNNIPCITKTYTANATDTITITNYDGSKSKNITININKIDKTKPQLTITNSSAKSQTIQFQTSVDKTNMNYDSIKAYIKQANEGDTSYRECALTKLATANTYQITGLQPNTTYTIKVAVLDQAGNEGVATKDITTEQTLAVTTDKYNIVDPYIENIDPGTTVEEIKNNIETNKEYEILKQDGTKMEDADTIGTGCKIKFETGEIYTLIVTGYIDGDGIIGINDLAKIKKHLVELEILQDIYIKAADIDLDNSITVNDLARVKKIIVEKNS